MTHDTTTPTSDDIVTIANGDLDAAIALLDLFGDSATNDKSSQRS